MSNFQVYGTADEIRFMYLGVENVDSTNRIMFGTTGIGGAVQDIRYADLIDYRGNSLPETINSPKVMIRFRSSHPAYLVGEESDSGFRMARDINAPGPISVDLFIYEMGA
ncbi:MAG: hypothetical protein GY865_00910 [candidate division Zixibacteria bacterium]|nr:hypothetical protein [candidate division Zixibacteria bacterium]